MSEKKTQLDIFVLWDSPLSSGPASNSSTRTPNFCHIVTAPVYVRGTIMAFTGREKQHSQRRQHHTGYIYTQAFVETCPSSFRCSMKIGLIHVLPTVRGPASIHPIVFNHHRNFGTTGYKSGSNLQFLQWARSQLIFTGKSL